MLIQSISSKSNPRIKLVLKSIKNPLKTGFAFVEGSRALEDALANGLEFEAIFLAKNTDEKLIEKLVAHPASPGSAGLFFLDDKLVGEIANTITPQGVFGLVKLPPAMVTQTGGTVLQDRGSFTGPAALEFLQDSERKIRLMICDGVADPGNLGNIMRTAEAFAFDALICGEKTVSPYNNKAIRASAGAVFRLNIIRSENLQEFLTLLKELEITLYAASLDGDNLTGKTDHLKAPCALILGNEGDGIRSEIMDLVDRKIRIPMPGKAESLNVASAAAILAYLCSLSK